MVDDRSNAAARPSLKPQRARCSGGRGLACACVVTDEGLGGHPAKKFTPLGGGDSWLVWTMETNQKLNTVIRSNYGDVHVVSAAC